ncbi:MAG: sugar ABC transporter permease [Clostridia bacterium]|nr:sugar ABC transporter permease [Clostridia bacterium]
MLGRSKITPYILIAPAILVLIFMVAYPLYYGIRLSFTNMNLYTFLNPEFIGIDNYKDIFKDTELYTTTIRTIVWTIINIILTVTLGFIFALFYNRKLPSKNIFRVIMMLPWAVPQYIAVLTWRNMFQQQYGTIDIVLNNMGITGISWLGDPFWIFTACIIVNVWLGVPFMMIITLGAMQSVPHELYEVGQLDGVKSWTKHLKITIPLIKPVLTPAIVLSTVWTFNMVSVIYMMTARNGDNDTQILVSRVYKDAFTFFNYGKAAAFSVIIFVLLLIFSSTIIKAMKGGEGVYE